MTLDIKCCITFQAGMWEPFLQQGVKIKNQVLSRNMIWWFSPHPLKLC